MVTTSASVNALKTILRVYKTACPEKFSGQDYFQINYLLLKHISVLSHLRA